MKCHLISIGWKVWETIEKEYKIDDQAPTDPEELGQYEGSSKALNAILSGLTNSVFTKVMRCKTSKQDWDKLKIIYEGASKVRESKIQTYKGQFDSLKMKEEDNIGEYLVRVDEFVLQLKLFPHLFFIFRVPPYLFSL